MKSEGRWVEVRGWAVSSYLLYDGEGVFLIDGGFVGGLELIERELQEIGKSWEEVRAILLTHGHLDHTLNVARLKELTGARVLAPKGEELMVAGRFPYRGLARVCGLLEALGRFVFGFREPEVDAWFEDGDEFDFWGGLRVVKLPGHTPGHSGFYAPSRKLLFCGDIFSNYLGQPELTPPWFTVDSDEAGESLHKAAGLELDGVLPNHCRRANPQEHLRDLRKLSR